MAIQDDAAGSVSKAAGFLLAFIRVVLLLFVGLLLSASLTLAIAANGVRLSLLDANFYIAQMDKADAYGLAKDTLINSTVDSMLADAPAGLGQNESFKAELKAGFSEAVPTSWVKAQADRLIRNAFAYAKSETSVLDLNVSTVELKPSIKAAARKLAPKLLAAAVGSGLAGNESPEIAAANDYFAKGGTGPAGCRSIDECLQYCLAHEQECASLNISQEQMAGALGDNASAAANISAISGAAQGVFEGLDSQIDASVPDQLDLDALASHEPSRALAQVREPLATALFACNLLVALCVALALVQAVVAWGAKNALRHVGIPFLITGAIATTASFVAPNVLLDMVSRNLPSAGGQAAQLSQVAMAVATPAVRGYFETTLVLSITVGVIGLAMVALSFVAERNEREARA
jgi:hypothetical protein